MVLSVCPLCGDILEGLPNIDNSAEWYRLCHPDLPVGSVIPEVCIDCSHDYIYGEEIVLRNATHTNVYTITSLIHRPNQPPLIVATNENGQVQYFAVTQIRPGQQQGKIIETTGDLKPGYF